MALCVFSSLQRAMCQAEAEKIMNRFPANLEAECDMTLTVDVYRLFRSDGSIYKGLLRNNKLPIKRKLHTKQEPILRQI